jgi:hypothetical protein
MANSRRRFRDITRLVHAVGLFARQQWERSFLGGADERDDVMKENEDIVGKILPIIEQALDEDLLEELDDAPPFGPSMMDLRPDRLFASMMPWLGARPARGRRGNARVDGVIDDFRDDLQGELRKKEGLTDEAFKKLVDQMRTDLEAATRRSRKTT